jgi:hypothetical protein
MHPTAGTIFHKSSTSLHLWFFAMHLITSTRGGISAKQLERELGVTYKTAWRMFNLIRNELMTDEFVPLTGAVEVDETAWGGRPKASATRGMTMPEAQTFAKARKVGVLAMVERGGKVRAVVQPREGALATASLHVDPKATVYAPSALHDPSRRPHLCARTRPHANRRRILREREARDQRRLPQRVRQMVAGLPQRVHVALQPPLGRDADVPDAALASSRRRRYFLGAAGADGVRTLATLLRLAKNRSRLGTGTVRPFGVCSVGSMVSCGSSGIDLQG